MVSHNGHGVFTKNSLQILRMNTTDEYWEWNEQCIRTRRSLKINRIQTEDLDLHSEISLMFLKHILRKDCLENLTLTRRNGRFYTTFIFYSISVFVTSIVKRSCRIFIFANRIWILLVLPQIHVGKNHICAGRCLFNAHKKI